MAVFLLCLDGLLFLCPVVLFGLPKPFGLSLHGDESHGASGEQRGHEDVGVGEHGGIEHFLCLLHEQQPVVMQSLGCRGPPLHGGDGHQRGAVNAVSGGYAEQYAPETLIMLYHVRHVGKCAADDSLRLLSDFVEHHLNGILNVGDLSGDGL